MRVVSTVHKAGWDVYGGQWVEGIKNWPQDTQFMLYTEGFDFKHPRIITQRIESVERAEFFKNRYKNYRPVSWQWDVVRFSNKTFAAYDALYDYDGIGVWLDADCETYSKIPSGWVETRLPYGKYLARFERIGMQTETGFWVMDCANSEHKPFMDTWVRWYEQDAFKTLPQWCDAYLMDATARLFKKDGRIDTVSLSEGHEKDMHPMAKASIAKYIDHKKGARKDLPASPENIFREAA